MKYGNPLLRSALATCVLLAAGCQTFESTLNTFTQPVQPIVAKTNEAIVGELVTLNKAEVAQSKIGLSKAHHRSVKAYAARMNHDHNMGLKETLRVSHKTGIKPVMDVSSQNIQKQSDEEIAQWNTLQGNAFDKAFIDDQVQNHAAALRQVDADIKLSTDPKLTKLLKESHHHIAQHLEKAKKLQKQLAQ